MIPQTHNSASYAHLQLFPNAASLKVLPASFLESHPRLVYFYILISSYPKDFPVLQESKARASKDLLALTVLALLPFQAPKYEFYLEFQASMVYANQCIKIQIPIYMKEFLAKRSSNGKLLVLPSEKVFLCLLNLYLLHFKVSCISQTKVEAHL